MTDTNGGGALPPPARVCGALLASAGLLAIASLFEAYSLEDASRMVVVAASPLVAGVLGHATQNRRAYLAAVEERARRAEESRELEARRRVEEERVRIARERHDLVAHQITLANAQASVAAHLFDTRPEQTCKSLQELIDTTSDALDDLRATVGLVVIAYRTGLADPTADPIPTLTRWKPVEERGSTGDTSVVLRRAGACGEPGTVHRALTWSRPVGKY